MENTPKINAIGFFKYFEKLVGYRMYLYIFLNFLVGLLDGIGLTMFVPLIYLATNTENSPESLGKLKFLIDIFNKFGLSITLFSALILMVAIFFLKGLLSYVRSLLFIEIQQSAIKKIRFKLIEALKNLSYIGFTKLDAGVIQNNMTTETGRLVQALILYFSSVQSIVMLLTYVMLAFFTNWQFAIMVAIGALCTNFIYKYLNEATKRNARKLSSIGRNFQAYLIQTITYFKYLKATDYFNDYEKKLKKEILDSEHTQYKIGKISAISDSLREPLIIFVIACVIFLQIKFFGGNMPSILAALLLFYRSLNYLATMQNFWNRFISNIPGLESVEDMITRFKNYFEPNRNLTVAKINNISLHNISLSYENLKVVDDITINIIEKTSVAFIGESGAGKTTLANIICGLIQADSGTFIFDKDKNLDLYDLNSYRKHVGYITQESVIFDDTLYNNITFWQPKTPENLEKFWKTIEMASLTNFVMSFNEKEDTPLGNNGILISGGQKQRISIARELYKDSELLIMDEATSALDSETEKIIKDNIDALHGKYTMVIIAHRLSTIKNVDIIYMMKKGKIIEYGSYEELYSKSEKFRNMVELQGF
jgi:subfamily B ATP-binding cassette protein MsbA